MPTKSKTKKVRVKVRFELQHHDPLMTRFHVIEEPGKGQKPILRDFPIITLEPEVLNALIPDFSPQHNSGKGGGDLWFEFE